jgi:hypothetical protein
MDRAVGVQLTQRINAADALKLPYAKMRDHFKLQMPARTRWAVGWQH